MAALAFLAAAPGAGDAAVEGRSLRPAAYQGSVWSDPGLACVYILVAIAADVGRTCFPDQNPKAQVALDDTVRAFETYMLAKVDGMTPEKLSSLKASQGVGRPKAALCRGEAVSLYQMMAPAAEGMLSATRENLAKPGGPTGYGCP